jgi:hypothetical protein
MNVCALDKKTVTPMACCAFCQKPLPVVDGQLRPWRAPNGAFFCNEFCADDAEEARFQTHLGARAGALGTGSIGR